LVSHQFFSESLIVVDWMQARNLCNDWGYIEFGWWFAVVLTLTNHSRCCVFFFYLGRFPINSIINY
jgi:hypothetical protein